MATDNFSCIPIEPNILENYSVLAENLIRGVKWNPKKSLTKAATNSQKEWREIADSGDAGGAEQLVLFNTIRNKTNKDGLVLPQKSNHVLWMIFQGLRIGLHVKDLFSQASGLEQLTSLNTTGKLPEKNRDEFTEKQMTAAAIAAFTTAYYVFWEISKYKSEEIGNSSMVIPDIPEVNLVRPMDALTCMVYYYTSMIAKGGIVNNESELVRMTLLYFEQYLKEIEKRKSAFKHTDLFTSQHYKLNGTEFVINGFEVDLLGAAETVEFNVVQLKDIIGNTAAKRFAQRTAERLICYDIMTRRNPFADLGGLPAVTMGYGFPGTGKSMLISALATLIKEYCDKLGIPFKFLPMPDNIVSTYQGGSAERMIEWMLRVLNNEKGIVLAPIDDAENNFQNRTMQGVSAGVREVIGVFLRYVEGAYAVAIKSGRIAMPIFTNIPEQIDPAVLSRIVVRFPITGAETMQDFMDQMFQGLKQFNEIDPNFVDLKAVSGYTFMSNQDVNKNIAKTYESFSTSSVDKIAELIAMAEKQYKANTFEFYGYLMATVQKNYPLFRSRDLRNVQASATSRIMDFDLESEWLEKPEVFFKQGYDRKREMIIELMKANMKKLTFSEIFRQELTQYLDNMARIASAEKERKINEMVEQAMLHQEVAKRLAKMQSV